MLLVICVASSPITTSPHIAFIFVDVIVATALVVAAVVVAVVVVVTTTVVVVVVVVTYFDIVSFGVASAANVVTDTYVDDDADVVGVVDAHVVVAPEIG